jgi:hypothetical protein
VGQILIGSGVRNILAAKVIASLQADPEELADARRQIKGGNVTGHVEQAEAELVAKPADATGGWRSDLGGKGSFAAVPVNGGALTAAIRALRGS